MKYIGCFKYLPWCPEGPGAAAGVGGGTRAAHLPACSGAQMSLARKLTTVSEAGMVQGGGIIFPEDPLPTGTQARLKSVFIANHET